MLVVSYGEWLSKLRAKCLEAEQGASADYATIVGKISGLKLIDFHEGLQGGAARGLHLTLSMEITRALSPSLAKLELLEASWIAGWMKEWLRTAEA